MFYRNIYEQWMRMSKIRKAIISFLVMMTVFIVTYSLVLPAITVENTTSEEVGIVTENETQTQVIENQEVFTEATIYEELVSEENTHSEIEETMSTESIVEENQPDSTISESTETTEENETTETTEDDGLQKEQMVLVGTDSEFKVIVTAPESAKLPVETDLSVEKIPEHSKEYYEKIVLQQLGEIVSIDLIDISLISNQQKVEPSDNVNVDIRVPIDLPHNVKIMHFKDDGTVEILNKKASNKEKVVFETDSFSVFAIIDKDKELPRITYEFQNVDGTPFEFKNSSGIGQTNQIVKNGDSLIEIGTPEVNDNKTFQGWFEYDVATNTYGKKVIFNEPLSVTETKTIIVRPVFEEVLYLTIYSNIEGELIQQKISVVKNNGEAVYDISNFSANPTNTKEKFVGWSTEPNGTLIPTDQLNNFKFKENTELYPVFKSAYKIEFYTGEGGPIVAPKFVVQGEQASSVKPSDPVWSGYRFIEWQLNGVAFDFNQQLTEDIKLTAKWEPAETTYTIVFWQQQVTDQVNAVDKNYEYAGQETRNGIVGQTVADVIATLENKYTGFQLNKDKSDQSTILKPEGKSVINVYFDRKIITMQFSNLNGKQFNDSRWDDTRYTTIFKGLYGSTLEQNGYEWPGNRVWSYFTSSSTSQMSFLGQFILPNDVRKVNNENTTIRLNPVDNETSSVYFYLQGLDGNYNLSDQGASSGSTVFNFSEKYTGFTVHYYERLNRPRNTRFDSGYIKAGDSVSVINTVTRRYFNLNVLYQRNTYQLRYLDPLNDRELRGYNVTPLLYEEPLTKYQPNETNANFVIPTTSRPGYIWDGKWYKDRNLTQEFNWNDIMPAHDMKVYAGFRPIQFDINIDLNGGEIATSEPTFYQVNYGEPANRDNTYTAVSRNYVEDLEGDHYYYVNKEEKVAYYTTDSSLPGIDLSKRYSYIEDAYEFLGWYDVRPDGSLKPFSFDTAVLENLTIKAAWRRVGSYKVTYSHEAVTSEGEPLFDHEGNRVSGSDQPEDKLNYADHSMAVIGDRLTAPDNYVFMGWYYNGKVYQPKDSYQILSELADNKKTITIYPVMSSIDDLGLNATQLIFDANGGKLNDLSEDKVKEITNNSGEVNSEKNQIVYSLLQLNDSRQAHNQDVFIKTGYTLIGWNQIQTEALNGNVEFSVNAEVGVDNKPDKSNTLYAVWIPNKYKVTIKKIVKGNESDKNISFNFKPSSKLSPNDFKLQDNRQIEFEVDYDSIINVVETDVEGFESIREVRHKGINVDGTNDDSIVKGLDEIQVDGDIEITFINTKKYQELSIQKVDAADENTPLSGAIFNLYSLDEHGNKKEPALYEGITSNDDGLLVVDDKTTLQLPIGKYYLSETKPPNGYNISQTGAIIDVQTTGITMRYKDVINAGEIISNINHNIYGFKFVNNKGIELPATGGVGNYWFTISGLILIFISALGIHLNKKYKI